MFFSNNPLYRCYLRSRFKGVGRADRPGSKSLVVVVGSIIHMGDPTVRTYG